MTAQSARSKSSITRSNPSKNPKLLVVIVIVILTLLVVIGFLIQNNIIKEIVDTSNQETNLTNANQNGNKQVTIETEDGKIEIKEGEIPDNFPSDITIYKGSSIERTTDGNNESSVQLKTADSVSKVADFYKADLEKNGWKEIKTLSDEESVVLTANKDERKSILVISTNKNDNKTSISIVVGIIEINN